MLKTTPFTALSEVPREVRCLVLLFLLTACRSAPSAKTEVATPRLGIVVGPRAKAEYETQPTPLVYGGGFLNKTLVFETLTRVDREGRLQAGLARKWSVSDDGLTWTFELRPDARFHSGAACDAEAVRRHMFRWLGGTDDEFIPAATRIETVEVRGPRTVVFKLRERCDLAYDLAIINPMAIVGPNAERGQMIPVLDGTGPFRIEEYEPMRRFLFARNDAYDGPRPVSRNVELRLYPAASPHDAIGLWALQRGQIDALIEDWTPRIPRDLAVKLASDPDFVVDRVPGSATKLLIFNAERAPFSNLEWRRRVAAAVDRGALIRDIEAGFATPASTLFAPGVFPWTQRPALAASVPAPPAERVRAEFVIPQTNAQQIRAGLLLAANLKSAGIDVELVFVDSGGGAGGELQGRLAAHAFDLAFAETWGVPYDPQTTLLSRFGPQPDDPTAVETPPFFQAPELSRLVLDYIRAIGDDDKARVARAIEEFVEREVAVVPLYVPDRIAVRRSELEGLSLDGHGYEIDLRRLRLAH